MDPFRGQGLLPEIKSRTTFIVRLFLLQTGIIGGL
jgi:hypothetical protein